MMAILAKGVAIHIITQAIFVNDDDVVQFLALSIWLDGIAVALAVSVTIDGPIINLPIIVIAECECPQPIAGVHTVAIAIFIPIAIYNIAGGDEPHFLSGVGIGRSVNRVTYLRQFIRE